MQVENFAGWSYEMSVEAPDASGPFPGPDVATGLAAPLQLPAHMRAAIERPVPQSGGFAVADQTGIEELERLLQSTC
jgi:hypothetical protein